MLAHLVCHHTLTYQFTSSIPRTVNVKDADTGEELGEVHLNDDIDIEHNVKVRFLSFSR